VKPGLRAYAEGFVKEGAGAGGCVLGAMFQSRFTLTQSHVLQEIEKNYENLIEKKLQV
jgi:NaMN:DMB phosphoribosyltransferase